MGWIGFDLDGTLADNTEWQGIDHVGKPLKETLARLKQHLAEGEDVRIFTARVNPRQTEREILEARMAIKVWCNKYIGRELPITCEKDWDLKLFYDDRAIQAERNTGRILPTQNTKL